ncbi:TPA: stage II sporulation protein M [Staphylococcus aureus]|uniref:stage II sporulation protein M n=1 Tax=Staphylococcus aureus TaxID=1280 RepID=UPI000A323B8B|nr:stage II sporulation protein M [Staphylococcus aureus]HCY3155998.1 stage II sporulation protein M [Staphylococcus aureus]
MLIIGGLLGCLVYYLLNIDLGKMIVAQDLNLQEIFFHNLIYFFSAIFGFLTLGLLNIGMLLINSGMLGFFIAHGIYSNQLKSILLVLAPHAIFEILALLIASTFSLGFLSYLYQKMVKKNKMFHNFVTTIITVIVLTIIASLLEVYVTIN